MAEFINLVATSDAFKLERYFLGCGGEASARAYAATLKAADEIKARIRINASNESVSPEGSGPGVVTGEYRDSYEIKMFPELNGGASAVIGTDHPAGRRLEWGFVGVDGLGRNIHQGPRPHVGPAVASVEHQWAQSLLELALLDVTDTSVQGLLNKVLV